MYTVLRKRSAPTAFVIVIITMLSHRFCGGNRLNKGTIVIYTS